MRTVGLGTLIVMLLSLSGDFSGSAADGDLGGRAAGLGVPLPPLETAEARRSIKKGFEYIVHQIKSDGTIGDEQSGRPDLGVTSIVGLAFLSEGSTPRNGRYSAQCRKLTYGVLKLTRERLQIPPGQEPITLVQRKIGRNADLFFATLFLAEVYGEAALADDPIRVELKRLVERICKAQQSDGTWGEESWAPILGTVLGWESLRSAHSAGFAVSASATAAGSSLLKQLSTKNGVKGGNWMHDFYKEAASLRVLRSLQLDHERAFEETVTRLLAVAKGDNRPFQQAGGEEFLAFYLVSECLMKDEQADRASWQPAITPKIIGIQNSDGSWTGHHCITDRTFCTAAALLTLMAPRLHLPISDL